MSLILPEVRAGFRDFTAQFEGVVPYAYCDVKGLVTVAVGNLIDPMGAALHLPWLRADGTAADLSDITADWHRVKALGPGHIYTHYHSPTGLHLSDEAMDDLVMSRLDADAVILVKAFPDFPSFPAPAQTAILSMAWAMGPGFPSTWPHFSASVRARDWAACAANCAINSAHNAGVIPRNKADAALFLQAAAPASEPAPAPDA